MWAVGGSGRGRKGDLARAPRPARIAAVEDVPRLEPPIYREEVLTIMGVLADINVRVEQIHAYLLEDDEGEQEGADRED